MLVTLDEAKLRVLIDTDASDSDITLIIQSASAAVLNYLKVSSLDSLAIGYPPVVPDNVLDAATGATLYLVGWFVRNRDTDADKEWEQGYLPRPVTALLYPLRDPALA